MEESVITHGDCFTGDSLITLENGDTIYVEELIKGDVLWGGHHVNVVLKTIVEKEVDMVLFNTGLGITPWHPIKISEDSNEWVFPWQLDHICKVYVENYYNLVLESGHIAHLNGFCVATLGHNFTENEVIRHPYFGTEKVIEDLKKMEGWKDGFLLLENHPTRDPLTGLINHISG